MPNPAADEARMMSDAELAESINEAYREMFNLQFQRGTRQLQNPMALRAARRQIARLRTILRERQLAEAAGAPLEPLDAGPAAADAEEPEMDAGEAAEEAADDAEPALAEAADDGAETPADEPGDAAEPRSDEGQA